MTARTARLLAGGSLEVDSAPSAGTTVTGKVAVTREVVAPS